MSSSDYKKDQKDRFLSLLRSHLVIAGGVEMPDDYLKAQTFEAILNMCFNNRVVLTVTKEEAHVANG